MIMVIRVFFVMGVREEMIRHWVLLASLLCSVITGPCSWVGFVDPLQAVLFSAGSQALSFRLSSFLLKLCILHDMLISKLTRCELGRSSVR